MDHTGNKSPDHHIGIDAIVQRLVAVLYDQVVEIHPVATNPLGNDSIIVILLIS